MLPRDRIAAAAERHRLDRDRRHSAFHHLNGEIKFILGPRGAILSMLIDSNDIVHSAAVAGQADDGREGPARRLGRQQVAEHSHAGPAFENEFLA